MSTEKRKDGMFKLADILEDKEINYLYTVKEKTMKLKEALKGHNDTKLSTALDAAEDMIPAIGKAMGRPDLGKTGQKKGEAKQGEDRLAKKKEGDDDLKRVDKDADVSGPLRRWAEPTRITTAVKEAEDFLKDKGCDDMDDDVGASGSDEDDDADLKGKDEKKGDDEDVGTMGNEPKIAEVLRQAEEITNETDDSQFKIVAAKKKLMTSASASEKEQARKTLKTLGWSDERIANLEKSEDMTPEVGKKMKRDDLGKYGRKGWEKEIKTDGEAPKVTKGESRLNAALDKAALQKLHGTDEMTADYKKWAAKLDAEGELVPLTKAEFDGYVKAKGKIPTIKDAEDWKGE